MNISILCIGKLKEKYWIDAVDEYRKRLSRFCKLIITEIAEKRLPDKAGVSEEKVVIEAESKRLFEKLPKSANAYIIVLDVKGNQMTSPELAGKFSELALMGKSDIVFVLGGSLGLSEELLNRANLRLSFSKMTFPHQLMRPLLLEQIYRAFKINANETYHK
ncbi:MAG: 23S rRNA (pseudouridine(1915)-N(3))-methyltransferase RlmH [Clostridia bacterium]|nr:23S rRNA (pseudouridine(1915)-N(3))-methyltransferase RlmH [Clostridia bacterium]